MTGATDGVACAINCDLASLGMTIIKATRHTILNVGGKAECVTFNVAELAIASGMTDRPLMVDAGYSIA